MQEQAVIILGHGSKSVDAIEDFNYIVETFREVSGYGNVFGAHMELVSPSLEEVVSEIERSGDSGQVVIIPYFLYNGNHIKKDIPDKIESLQGQYPHLDIRLGAPIGKEDRMIDLLIQKLKEIQ
jgi:sirohydrochlorin cobaltochelatase